MPTTKRKKKHRKADRRKRRQIARYLRAASEGEHLWLEADSAAELAAAGDESKGPRKFAMKAYSGGRMRPSGFYYDVVVDLSGVRVMQGKRPSYVDHDRRRIVGHTTAINVDKSANTITAEGVVSGAGEDAREVVESADNGFPWRSSIGGPIREREFIEKGRTTQANGRTFRGPVVVIRAMDLAEISFVSLAGQDTARAKIAANADQLSRNKHMGFEQWLAAQGFDADKLDEKQLASLQAMFDELHAGGEEEDDEPPREKPRQVQANRQNDDEPSANVDDLVASFSERAADEAERHADIRRLCAKYGTTEVKVEGQTVQLEAHAIREGWTKAQVELECLRASRPQEGPAIHTRGGNQEHAGGAIEAALCLSAGLGEEIAAEGVSEQAMDLAAGREYRGAGVQALMHEVIRASGSHMPPGRATNDFIRAAFRADQDLQASGNATVSLSGILGNVANKSLLRAYRAVPDVVHEFCDKASNRDFKAATRYRLTGDATFQEVGADGELKSFELGDESYTNALKTLGRIVQLSRQMIINDDLGAFLQLPRILGRGGALARNKAVFNQMLAAVGSFFASGNGNYLEGASTALSIEALTEAEKLFLEQTDADGNPIEVMPKTLLVGPGNKVLAEQLFADRFVNETTTANKPKTTGNPHAGKFKPVATPWLTSPKVTGTIDTAWALFGDPADVPAMEIAYLNGVETPVLESSEADFDTLGMKWRSYWDFGVAMANETGAVFVKGKA